MSETISSLEQAIDYFLRMLESHPQRNGLTLDEALYSGERRKYPVIYIGRQARTDDPDEPVYAYTPPKVDVTDGPEGILSRDIIGMLGPLKLHNPIFPYFGLGKGTGTLATSFGITLSKEFETPTYSRSLDDLLAESPPDPCASGLLPEIRERIELIKANVPDYFKISLPDMQGPFNIAHMIAGEQALIGPVTDPDKFGRLMDRITTFWIQTQRNLVEWIGSDRLACPDRFARIAECSVNLISPRMYREFVLPYDLRIAEAFGPLRIHACSGPHVFQATLELLPEVMETDCGFIAHTAAGYTEVDQAFEALGGRNIVINIGQELPEQNAFEFISKDIDRYESNPLIRYAYTGMHWKNKDCQEILDLHRRLDEYWDERYSS